VGHTFWNLHVATLTKFLQPPSCGEIIAARLPARRLSDLRRHPGPRRRGGGGRLAEEGQWRRASPRASLTMPSKLGRHPGSRRRGGSGRLTEEGRCRAAHGGGPVPSELGRHPGSRRRGGGGRLTRRGGGGQLAEEGQWRRRGGRQPDARRRAAPQHRTEEASRRARAGLGPTPQGIDGLDQRC
jgi:hypothetical protein